MVEKNGGSLTKRNVVLAIVGMVLAAPGFWELFTGRGDEAADAAELNDVQIEVLVESINEGIKIQEKRISTTETDIRELRGLLNQWILGRSQSAREEDSAAGPGSLEDIDTGQLLDDVFEVEMEESAEEDAEELQMQQQAPRPKMMDIQIEAKDRLKKRRLLSKE